MRFSGITYERYADNMFRQKVTVLEAETMDFWNLEWVSLHRSFHFAGKVLGCLVTLYVFLGLLYGALLSIAVDVRQEEWLGEC